MIWSVLHTRQTHLVSRIEMEMVEGDKFKVNFAFNRRMYRPGHEHGGYKHHPLSTSELDCVCRQLVDEHRNAEWEMHQRQVAAFHTIRTINCHRHIASSPNVPDVRALSKLVRVCGGRELNGIKLIVQVENMKIVIYAIKQFYSNEAPTASCTASPCLESMAFCTYFICWSCVDASSHWYAQNIVKRTCDRSQPMCI